MEHGTVKSFDNATGEGWILPADGVQDLFVHRRNLGDRIKTLPVDAKVSYESRTNEKGIEAFNVSLSE